MNDNKNKNEKDSGVKDLFNVKSMRFAMGAAVVSNLAFIAGLASETKGGEYVASVAVIVMLGSLIRTLYLRDMEKHDALINALDNTENQEDIDRFEIITAEDLKKSGAWDNIYD